MTAELMQIYSHFLTGVMIVMAVLIIVSIIRSVLGPGISDRIIAVNMTGTMIIMMIAILSVFLDENYLVDVCLIYAMISFLGVVVLCKVYTGVYLQRRRQKADLRAIEENLNHQEIVGENMNEMPEGRAVPEEQAGEGEQIVPEGQTGEEDAG